MNVRTPATILAFISVAMSIGVVVGNTHVQPGRRHRPIRSGRTSR